MNRVTRSVSLIAFSMLVAAPSLAQSTGVFTPTGNMTVPRSFHTAIRLHDGKVLIIGGCPTSTEVYDPASHTFTPTGSTPSGRCGAGSATLLADGRVLIAGEYRPTESAPGYEVLRSAELYDPSAGTFTPTGDMIGLQIGHTATLLSNGRVLIAGGLASTCCLPAPENNPELYDPVTGTFRLTGAFAGSGNIYVTGGPAVSAAVALSDGRVLIAAEPTSELYDPVAGTFQLTGVMTTPCWGDTKPGYIYGRRATLLTNGLVLLTGGEHEDCGRFANAELYDVVTGTFTATGSMTRPRDSHSATLLSDGTVLIAGGESSNCDIQGCFLGVVASAEVFDPSTGTFTPTGDMSARRAAHSATALNDGTVLVAGGYWFVYGQVPCCVGTAGAELYVPSGQLASPDSTTVPTAAQIVDTSGAVWTIGPNQAILRNGLQAAGGWGSKMLWTSNTIYVLGTDSNWWQWTGSGWLNIGSTIPGGGGTTSPDGTTVPLNASQIIDNIGAVWTIGSGGAILRDGSQAAGGWGSQILWKSSTIYVLGTDSNWWRWTGSGWMNVGPIQP
jgi:galactose oxidase-like protein